MWVLLVEVVEVLLVAATCMGLEPEMMLVEVGEVAMAVVVVGMVDMLVGMTILVLVELRPTCFHVQEKRFGVA